MNSVYNLIVLGGGAAGLVVATGAAMLGARVLLVEKKALGGDCLYTGCVPSKALIRSARFAAQVNEATRLGFEPMRWRFANDDFASVIDRVQRVIEAVAERDAPERFRAVGVEIQFGAPRFISRNEVEIHSSDTGGRRVVQGQRFCLATGSHPAIPPIDGLIETGFQTTETIFQQRRLPASMIVVGGGPVGLELGQSFARFGARVSILEMGDRLLPREEPEVSRAIEEALRAEGIEILLNTTVVRAARLGGRRTLTVQQAAKQFDLATDEILVATGRQPNTDGLNLEAAGVVYDKQRVKTDAYLRTTIPHIYAAGDITGHFPFTHMAAYEASVVLRNALAPRILAKAADFRVVPWATYTDPEIARVGLTEAEARHYYGSAKVRVFRAEFRSNDRALTDEASTGFAKLICTGRKDRLVGVHLMGARAGELIHEVVLAMKQGLSARDLGGMIHVYPTLSQVVQEAGLNAVMAQISPRLRKYLSYYFKLRR